MVSIYDMEITKEQLKQIEDFAKKKIQKNDISHQLPHIQRTIKISKLLAKKEKADILKSIIIAWLHDIEKNKELKGINHGDEGAKSARKFLIKINLKNKDIDEICYAIKQHNKEGIPTTKEAKVIYDADKLQLLGVEGIIRIYGHLTMNGVGFKKAYKTTIKEQKFYSQRIKTKTGKALAKKKLNFFKKIVKQYNKELK